MAAGLSAAEVARELCAHFRDGLASGASPEALRGAFGDTRRAAQLLTRARKRLRPLWWRASRRAASAGCSPARTERMPRPAATPK